VHGGIDESIELAFDRSQLRFGDQFLLQFAEREFGVLTLLDDGGVDGVEPPVYGLEPAINRYTELLRRRVLSTVRAV